MQIFGKNKEKTQVNWTPGVNCTNILLSEPAFKYVNPNSEKDTDDLTLFLRF